MPGDAGRRTVSLHTIGCKLNQFETCDIERQFAERGWEIVPFGAGADVCVVNTCTVTARSDYRCRQALRRARRENPGGTVIAVGCYAQTRGGNLAAMPEVDLVLGNAEKAAIFAHLDDTGRPSHGPLSVSRLSETRNAVEAVPIRAFSGHTRAFVKIQDGCDARCSYCIVPDARGPNRSLPPGRVTAQVAALVSGGYREVVLTGVHLGTWGRDLAPPLTLGGLLADLVATPGLERLRLSSIEPTEFTPELIEVLAATPKICPHLHLPLQSGAARVLRSMRRPYTPELYARIVNRLASILPDPGIGADVIAGFPGERPEDHEETLGLITALPLTYLHVFPYSPRPGTPAAGFSEQVPAQERERRAAALRRLGRAKAAAFRDRHVGTTVSALVEGRPDPETGLHRALTGNYLRVLVAAPAWCAGSLRQVKITRHEGGRLHGEIVD